MAINAEWHEKHRMPPRATLEQRVEWHLEHAKHCGRRPVPSKVRTEIRKRRRAAQRKD